MNRRKFAFAVCLLLAAGVAPARGSVVLVQDGRPRAAIYVAARVMAPNQVPAPTRFAAREAEGQRQRLRESVKDLAHYLGLISGADIEVVTGPPAKGDRRLPIRVGELAVQAFGPPGKKAPYRQGFRLVVTGRGVGLLGESDLAASYAIYELLDRLGCRWYMPSSLGEVIPRRRTIALEETDFSSAPATIYRGVWYADDGYRRRNRLGGLLLNAGHALEFYLSKEDRAKHPEWRAVIRGKPHPSRLKWSSPAVAEAIAGKILAAQARDPQVSYSLSPDDGADFDESKEDRALDARDFDPVNGTNSITDRLMVLTNRIAARVTAKYPDLLFGVLAYVQYTRPPVREKVHPNLVPQIAPISYSRMHPMTDDRVPGNKTLRYLIEGWGKKARMTSYYAYAYNLAETSAPQPMLTKWATDVPIVLRNNCKFWQPETLPNFETHMQALYLGNRLAWDPKQKPADILAELNAKFYGHAAREMAAYWQYLDDVWVKTPEYSGCGFGYLRRWGPDRLKAARRLLNEALAACKTPLEKRRVGLADDSLRQFERFMKMRWDLAEGRFAHLAAEAAEWQKRAVALGEKYKDQYCFTRVPWTPKTVNGLYFASFYAPAYQDATRIAEHFQILTTPPLRRFRYRADPDKKGEALGWARADFDDSRWKTTDVCLETWSTLGYHDYFKSMWYRTEVSLPAVPKDRKVYLWLGSTDGSAKVFVNGKQVPYTDPRGKQQEAFNGYCRPVSLDITRAVRPGAANRIALFCTRTFFNELGTGGLIGPVVVYREK